MKTIRAYKSFVTRLIASFVLVVFLAGCTNAQHTPANSNMLLQTPSSQQNVLDKFAAMHQLPLSAWPDSLLELMEKNPEVEEFVLNYPIKKDLRPEIDLSEYENSRRVPLLMQWDERWGYSEYAGELMGVSGCGPTCLSMVLIHLLGDTDMNPRYVADFAERNGYGVEGNGSSWTLISQGGEQLGLDITEIPLDKNRIMKNLEVGNPIICVMGPGDFTTTGHFIIMVGCKDGKVAVNDPNSRIRSDKLWDFDSIKGQIRNLWVCRRL